MRFVTFAFLSAALSLPRWARGDEPPLGVPPPDATAAVAAPKANEDVPKIEAPTDETNVTLSAGGQLSTGNSRMVAATANGKFAMRRGADAFGAGLLGNYGESATPGQSLQETTENIQGRLRYDRFLVDRMSLFLIGTGLHDRFEGLQARINVDPGAKYLFVHTGASAFWGELGYDFQYDYRLASARVEKDSMGVTELDASGNPLLLDKTHVDHSARFFVGLKHAFNKEVSFTTGFEYLQSCVHSTRYRFNYDALFAANVGGGLSLGLGFTAHYDHDPLPTKKDLDTTTTINLIYSLTEASKPGVSPPPSPAAVPEPEPAPVPAPAPAPAVVPPAPAPASAPTTATTTTLTTTATTTTLTTPATSETSPGAPAAPPPPPPVPSPNP
jgi:putative salt-induced outer membrane protein YdiY